VSMEDEAQGQKGRECMAFHWIPLYWIGREGRGGIRRGKGAIGGGGIHSFQGYEDSRGDNTGNKRTSPNPNAHPLAHVLRAELGVVLPALCLRGVRGARGGLEFAGALPFGAVGVCAASAIQGASRWRA
jgi:hypothetical protein